MKITKITLYNVPFRYSTQDRIIENVDAKIERWKKDDINSTPDEDGNASFDKISYSITNGFEGTITINSENRYNYARLVTDLYGGKIVYVFLHTIKEYESSIGFTYDIKIDVMASFGKELLETMNGKNVLIDRMHEDRYVENVARNSFIINSSLHGLANTDFQVGDTVGQSQELSSITLPSLNDPVTKCNVALDSGSHNVDIQNKRNDRYFYALIAAKGQPQATNVQMWRIGENFKNDILICPLNVKKYENIQSITVEQATNTLDMFENLQDGKVMSIFSIPFKLHGDLANVDCIGFRNHMQGVTSDWTRLKANNDFIAPTYDNNDKLNYEYLIGFPFSFNAFTIKDIFDNFAFNTKFKVELGAANKTLWKQWLNSSNFEEYSRFELGMLNNGITPMSIYHNGEFNHIDFYDILRNNPTLESKNIDFKYVLSEDGMKATMVLTNNQYTDFESFNTISFYTDAGKSYLAQNGAYMNAQKRGIELQGELQKTQVRSQRFQSGAAAANPVAAVMSLGTSLIGNAGAAAYNTQELGEISKITDNDKAKIDAHIQDLSQTSPITHAGNGKGWGWATLPTRFGSTFTYAMKYPNINLARKIYFYLQKHGYKIDDWMTFSSALYNSRDEWNMLTISSALDYIPQTNYDDSIVNEFAARLEHGVRIWHKDDFTIDYSKVNLEKSLKTWLG